MQPVTTLLCAMPATLALSPELEAAPTRPTASISSNGERSTSRAEARTTNWREEQAVMQHQLRQAKAEIAHLYVPFGLVSSIRTAARSP